MIGLLLGVVIVVAAWGLFFGLRELAWRRQDKRELAIALAENDRWFERHFPPAP